VGEQAGGHIARRFESQLLAEQDYFLVLNRGGI